MRRRTYLGLCSTLLLAGCSGSDDGGSGDGGGGATTPEPTDTATAEPTATNTPDPTTTATEESTPTPEPTPTPNDTEHAVGETFTVGEGQAAEYTVTDVREADSIGGEFGVKADGVFVVVALEVTNRASESFTISSNLFTLTDGQGRSFDVDTDGVSYAENSIIFEQLNPDVTTSGVVVFDVPTDQESRTLEIAPASILSTAETHTVEL